MHALDANSDIAAANLLDLRFSRSLYVALGDVQRGVQSWDIQANLSQRYILWVRLTPSDDW